MTITSFAASGYEFVNYEAGLAPWPVYKKEHMTALPYPNTVLYYMYDVTIDHELHNYYYIINTDASEIMYDSTSKKFVVNGNFRVGFVRKYTDENGNSCYWMNQNYSNKTVDSQLKTFYSNTSDAHFLISDIPVLDYATGDKIMDGGSSESSAVYSSLIPAPKNLQFSYSNEGGVPIVHLGGTSYHKLTWSNELVDPFSVRISVKVHILDTGSNEYDKEIMIASDGTDGADFGIAASSKMFKYDFGSLADKICGTGVVDKAHLQAWTATQYRVQFYQYDSGVLNVGPVGVVHLKKNMFGSYSGTVVTTEVPIDKENLGSSGGLMPGDASDSWSASGQDYNEFDPSGGILGSGVVGDDSSYVSGTSHNAFTSITDFLNSLVNIPTVISQLFDSLSNMMSGLGELPTFFGSLFSSMPSTILTMIGIGISLAVVLRIIGR